MLEIGDRVNTEMGIGEIINEEVDSLYKSRRFGIKLDNLPDSYYILYPDEVLYFFEEHLKKI